MLDFPKFNVHIFAKNKKVSAFTKYPLLNTDSVPHDRDQNREKGNVP